MTATGTELKDAKLSERLLKEWESANSGQTQYADKKHHAPEYLTIDAPLFGWIVGEIQTLESLSTAEGDALKELRAKVETKKDFYIREQRRMVHPENRMGYETTIAALKGVLAEIDRLREGQEKQE